jgi:hypothetical protein
MLDRNFDTPFSGEIDEITRQTNQADIAPASAGGNSAGPPSNGRPPPGCCPPSKGRGHCSLCGERRVDPTRAGVAWRECKDCGDPLAVVGISFVTLIDRNLF